MQDFTMTATGLRADHNGYMIGTVTLFGASYHLEAVKVRLDKDGVYVAVGGMDNQSRLEDWSPNGVYQPSTIPGVPGLWVFNMSVYGT